MTKEMVCFDVETTGLNQQTNYIIQLAVVRFNSQTFETVASKNWYILPKDPNFEIEPIAFEKHGITKEFLLENGVTLDSVYTELVEIMKDADVLTYNGNNFDVSFLYKDLKEYGLELNYDMRYYDAFKIENKRNSNTLAGAYQRYTQEELVDAHNAYTDVNATIEVFKHQLQGGIEDIETNEFDMISPDGFLKFFEDTIVFNKGKYSRKNVVDVCKEDPSYIRWLFETCSKKTKQTIINEYYRIYPKK